jgi:hypothetical protein
MRTLNNKLKYLREYFKRELKKNIRQRSGEGLKDTPKWLLWQYSNMMHVLHTDKVESSSHDVCKANDAEEDFKECEDSEGQIEDNFETPSPSPIPSVSFRHYCIVSAPSCGYKKERKNKKSMCLHNEFLYVERRKLELSEISEDEYEEGDEDLLFLESLLPDINSLPRGENVV